MLQLFKFILLGSTVLYTSLGDPNDFFRIRIQILFFRSIRIRIRLLSDPDSNPNRFGFGSESKLTLKTKQFQNFKNFLISVYDYRV